MTIKFYVYYLRRPDKVDPLDPSLACPFYVGKGCNGRINEHRREAQVLKGKPGRKSIKIRVVHKLWKQGLDFQEDIILDGLSEQEAFEIEKEAIEVYGRIDLGTGCLANMTDGGEGNAGRIVTKEFRSRVSEVHKGKNVSYETRQKLRMANLGKKASKETREKLKGKVSPKGFLGRKHTIETKEKMSMVRKGKSITDKHKEKLREANIGKKHSIESRKKMSESHKGQPSPRKGVKATDETRQKLSKAFMGRIPWNKGLSGHLSEKTIEKMRENNLGKVISEETKNKIGNALRNKVVSEETRRKISESRKGITFSIETKRKISEANKRRPPITEETRKKLVDSHKGKPWSEARREAERLRKLI